MSLSVLSNPTRSVGRMPVPILIGATAAALTLGSLHCEIGTLVPSRIQSFYATGDVRSLVLIYAWLPRLAIGLLVGAALGVAGALFQHALKNPLAAPATLGLSAGAKLALSMATLYAPWLLTAGSDFVAIAGAAAVGGIVFLVARRSGFSPLVVILTGMVLALCCGAISTTLAIVYQEWLTSLFIWGNGSLVQESWRQVGPLLLKCVPAVALALFLARRLEMLGLNDVQAAAVGARPSQLRLLCLLIGGWLTAVTVAAVGIVAFVGLAAPAIAKLAGVRRLGERIAWSAFFGALVLCCADQATQMLESVFDTFVPTGATTGLFGAPLLILLVWRLKAQLHPASTGLALTNGKPVSWPRLPAVLILVLLCALVLLLGRYEGGWQIDWGLSLEAIWPWRAPRVLAAAAAGAMLALAGTVLQRMTANPMASPETLGISAGAALGMIVALFSMPNPSVGAQIAGASIGAGAVLVLIFAISHRGGYSPERIVIAGIALTAFFDAFVAFLMAGGDPRASRLISWSAGSTYGVDFERAIVLSGVAVFGLACVPAFSRWLNILPLGPVNAQSVGLDIRLSRAGLLLFAALLTGAATLLIGPLSFAGLIAPHLARFCGFRRALPQGLAAGGIGAVLMMVADWIGRVAFFPWQVPAGLVAALITAPLLVWLLLRADRSDGL